MCLVPGFAKAGNGNMMVWLFLGHMLCFMPTLGLANSVAFSHVKDQTVFPKIRVWGTIGWIIGGLAIGFLGWSASFNIFWVSGTCSLLMGGYCFTLPHTPPPAKDEKVNIRSLLMVDAFKLLTKSNFLVFIICSTLICIPLAYYYGATAMYLGNSGFEQPASSMTIGQMSEIVFMLLIPFFFRKFGVKIMILVGMLAWVARYGLFAIGAPNQITWMLFLGIALHGVCYDFFFVTGFMYTDKVANKSVRNQAQSMLVFFTQGVGTYFGYWVAFDLLSKTVTKYGDLTQAVNAAHPAESLTTSQMLLKMFAVTKWDVNSELYSEVMNQWSSYWWAPAIMAGVIAVIFFAAFWDKMSNYDEVEEKEITKTEEVAVPE